MASGPTQRSLDYCRKRGWRPWIVERYIAPARKRIDLFGGIDVVVLDGEPGLLGIQCTTQSGASQREVKLADLDDLKAWLEAGLRLEVWGWRKVGKASERRVWKVRRRRARLIDGWVAWDLVEEE